jgi:chromosome segregation and condensation protein ScpB
MDAKRKEVDQLLSDKRNIERKIEKIQTECKHSKQVIKQVADGNSFAVRRVCESCGHILGYASPEDTKKFLEK